TPMTNNGVVVEPAGTLVAKGTIGGGVNNGGMLSPGSAPVESPGVLNVSRDYAQAATGKLRIEIGAAGADRLFITGSATLGGTLELSALNGYTPAFGDSFSILRALAGRTGTFANVSGVTAPGAAGLSYAVYYSPTDVFV